MTSLSPRRDAAAPRPLAERRVMVFPAATEVALEAQRALGGRRDVVLSSAGLGGPTHAPLVFDRHHAVPHVADPEWVPAMAQAVADEAVDYILPAHDDAVVPLLEAEATLGVTVLAPPLTAARTARSKRATHALEGPIPAERFPVFCKPDAAQGSLGAEPAADAPAVARLRGAGSDLVTELLPGEELTVDCLSALGGELLFAGPRRRERTRAGISMRSTPVDDPALVAMARGVSESLAMRGAWFLQAKRDALGVPVLMEVGARIAGTSAVQRARGVNLPLLALYEREGHSLDVRPLPIEVTLERALVNRYLTNLRFARLYVDLDDTLVRRSRVDPALVAVLFQHIAAAVPVILLTRHRGDLAATLREHRLDGIFDDVIHVADGEDKTAHMGAPPALLIDDSHAERAAALAAGHLALDPSAAELLVDDRR
jgi:hypothetical protein